MRGEPYGDGRRSGRHQVGNGFALAEHERQATRPEALGERFGDWRELEGDPFEHRPIEHVDDERIEARALFDFEDSRDRQAIESKPTEAVDGFGWEGNGAARTQHLDCARDRRPVRRPR